MVVKNKNQIKKIENKLYKEFLNTHFAFRWLKSNDSHIQMPATFCLPLWEGFCQPSQRIQIPPSSLLSLVYFFSQSALFFFCKILKIDNREGIGQKSKHFYMLCLDFYSFIYLYMTCKIINLYFYI